MNQSLNVTSLRCCSCLYKRMLAFAFLLILCACQSSLDLSEGALLRYDDEKEVLSAAFIDMYHPENQVKLRLVAMVHVADADFYAKVLESSGEEDLVLLEGVRGVQSLSLKSLQLRYYFNCADSLRSILSLADQGMHYQPDQERAVNADLSLEDMKGLDPWYQELIYALSLPLSVAFGETSKVVSFSMSSLDVGGRYMRKNFAMALAESLQDLNEEDSATNEALLPGIISSRNERLLTVLEEERGKGERSFLIPWGAAHMPSLLRDLEKKGYAIESTDYVPLMTVAKSREDSMYYDFYVPWILSHYRCQEKSRSSFFAGLYEEGQDAAFNHQGLLWGQLFLRQKGEAYSYCRFLPLIGAKPIFFDYRVDESGQSRVRCCYFFEF